MKADNILNNKITNFMANLPSDFDIYLVGGAVRDYFMNTTNKDLDFTVVTKDYDTMVKTLYNNGFKIFVESPKYLTVRAQFPKYISGKDTITADFVLARKDGIYKDGRHPESVEVGTILDDLKRRDLTINAIAVNIRDNEIIDPFGGYNDIEYNRVIKCVGKHIDRFNEDALRILRALRFFVKYHNYGFELDFSIANLLFIDGPYKRTRLLSDDEIIIIDKLKNISIERKIDELTKMFKYDSFFAIKVLSWLDNNIYNNLNDNDRTLWFIPTIKKI